MNKYPTECTLCNWWQTSSRIGLKQLLKSSMTWAAESLNTSRVSTDSVYLVSCYEKHWLERTDLIVFRSNDRNIYFLLNCRLQQFSTKWNCWYEQIRWLYKQQCINVVSNDYERNSWRENCTVCQWGMNLYHCQFCYPVAAEAPMSTSWIPIGFCKCFQPMELAHTAWEGSHSFENFHVQNILLWNWIGNNKSLS